MKLEDAIAEVLDRIEDVEDQVIEGGPKHKQLKDAIRQLEKIHYTIQNSRQEFRHQEVEAE